MIPQKDPGWAKRRHLFFGLVQWEAEPELRRPGVRVKMMKSISADMIPEHFWRIRYDQNHDPNTPTLPSISDSPNCQNFAYALLKHFGFEIFPFRSSNLWLDSSETYVVSDELRSLDLLLFNRTKNPWGAHVALYLGEDHAIHLSKKQSEPVIWPLAQFLQLAEYRNFIGAKRLRNIGACP
jgi:lipoprotein Spr